MINNAPFASLCPLHGLLKNQLVKRLRRPRQHAFLDTLFTYTGFVCSIRCAQSMACKSAYRFLFGETIIVSMTLGWGNETNQWTAIQGHNTCHCQIDNLPTGTVRVVSKKMEFSLAGLLYSSIATIWSSCAVPPSIWQHSTSGYLGATSQVHATGVATRTQRSA